MPSGVSVSSTISTLTSVRSTADRTDDRALLLSAGGSADQINSETRLARGLRNRGGVAIATGGHRLASGFRCMRLLWHYSHTVLDGFTEEARSAITRAQHEALGMGHPEVQVEHLLLGLFSHQQDVAAQLLADSGLTIEPVRDLVRTRLGTRPGSVPEEHPRFSRLSKDVLTSAYRFGMGEADTAHILIVIVAKGEGARDILRSLGVDPDRLRFEAKMRAFPHDARSTGPQLKATVRPMLPELDFGD